ncbi:MAG: hypothetical protein PHV08_07905 [Sulfurovaceae bacterium]|nr:hypothetical protein [Sulfurovaceae bacterium]
MKITMWILGAAMMLSGCATIEQSFKPQSYPCVIGCGDEGFTPDKGYYYDPTAPGKQRPLSEYYEKNK